MDRAALIVAHGQPSAPGPAAAELTALARQVADLAPGWRVEGATLADPGAVERVADRLGPALVLPYFMADGWFTRHLLPKRLAGAAGMTHLPAFGTWTATAALAVSLVEQALQDRHWRPDDTGLILAAHGSAKSRGSARSTEAIAAAIATALPIGRIGAGYLEEPPYLADAARGFTGRALCLPLFIARWGHVEDDLPAALSQAGFTGETLAPLGTAPEVPALLAAALTGFYK